MGVEIKANMQIFVMYEKVIRIYAYRWILILVKIGSFD